MTDNRASKITFLELSSCHMFVFFFVIVISENVECPLINSINVGLK
jgi:hypothetical protein